MSAINRRSNFSIQENPYEEGTENVASYLYGEASPNYPSMVLGGVDKVAKQFKAAANALEKSGKKSEKRILKLRRQTQQINNQVNKGKRNPVNAAKRLRVIKVKENARNIESAERNCTGKAIKVPGTVMSEVSKVLKGSGGTFVAELVENGIDNLNNGMSPQDASVKAFQDAAKSTAEDIGQQWFYQIFDRLGIPNVQWNGARNALGGNFGAELMNAALNGDIKIKEVAENTLVKTGGQAVTNVAYSTARGVAKEFIPKEFLPKLGSVTMAYQIGKDILKANSPIEVIGNVSNTLIDTGIATTFAALGQAILPVPFLGSCLGSMVGTYVVAFKNDLVQAVSK